MKTDRVGNDYVVDVDNSWNERSKVVLSIVFSSDLSIVFSNDLDNVVDVDKLEREK